MIAADRLRVLIEERSSQSELARRVGVSQGAISGLLSGRSTGSKHLPAIARVLGTSPEYLLGETDDPAVGALLTPTAETIADQLDSVMVPLYELDFSMGDGTFFNEAATPEMIPFKKPWLRSHIAGRVDEVMMITGKGDSMTPTISDGDVLLIDRAQKRIEDPDMIWAFGYGETGYVKRLRPLPRKRVEVNSDNPAVRSWTIDMAEIDMVGRVVSILRWQ